MKFIYILILICLTSCNSENVNVEKLIAKNELLQNRITELEKKKVNQKSINSNPNVTIADTELKEIESKYNGQNYTIKVWYPKNYHENKTKKYPVLYITDAETNFGGISYIVKRLIKDKLIPEIIIVGIAYTTDYKDFYRLRSRDLTPFEDKELRLGNNTADPTGGASLFSDFIAFELFPFISENYRIKEDDRAIYGHSYGGLFGSYILLEKPELFNRYLLLSPSLWFKKNALVKQLKTDEKPIFTKKTQLYMASGELEGRIDDLQIEFIDLLKSKKIDNLNIRSEIKANETHRTIFGVGFTNGLRHIYTK